MNDFVPNKRRTGAHYEEKASAFLTANGFTILERNYRIHIGEIDIIAREGQTVCFVEVKYRSNGKYGRPGEAVTPKKQKTIIKVSEYWLLEHRLYNCYRRYDVIEITGGNISLIRNAY